MSNPQQRSSPSHPSLLVLTVGLSLAVSVSGQMPMPPRAPGGGAVDIFTTYDGETLRKGEYTFSAAFSAYDKVDVQTLALDSKLLARQMPYRIILPATYAEKNDVSSYPVIYLLHGLAGHYDNWTDKTRLIEYAADNKFIIVTPEGADGWYTDSSTIRNDKYESYIIQELIPEIDKKFRTMADRDHRMIAGLSMGGYGAIKFGLKYPDRFSLVGSFSGAVDAPLRGQDSPFLRPSIISVFGADGSKTRKDNDLFGLLRGMPSDKLKTLPYIYLSCGTEDAFFSVNHDYDGLLLDKKVPHEYREHPGGHDWSFWDDQVREFLQLAGKRFAGK